VFTITSLVSPLGFFVLHDLADSLSATASQPLGWYDLLTGSGEQCGKLEEKIEEGPQDLSKCKHLDTVCLLLHLSMFQ